MSRTFRIKNLSASEAMALSEVINAEGHWATYMRNGAGADVLALCPMPVRDNALRMFGLDAVIAR